MYLLKVAKFYRYLYVDLPSHHTIVCKFCIFASLRRITFKFGYFTLFRRCRLIFANLSTSKFKKTVERSIKQVRF